MKFSPLYPTSFSEPAMRVNSWWFPFLTVVLFSIIVTKVNAEQAPPIQIGSDDLRELRLLLTDDSETEQSAETQDESENIREALVQPENGKPNDSVIDASKDQREYKRSIERLAELRKSPMELRIAPPNFGTEEVPENQAATLLINASPQLIVGGYLPIPRAERVYVAFCHQPTYFQELNLERCGQPDCPSLGCFQNVYSSVWFMVNTSLLPYRLVSQPHCRCVRAYDDCRTCQQYETPIEPLCSDDANHCYGMLSEAAAMAGFAFLLL